MNIFLNNENSFPEKSRAGLSEQEFETEKYVKNFLQGHGIDMKVPINNQTTFLIGIYNGMVITRNMMLVGCTPEALSPEINMVANHVNTRKKMAKEVIDNLKIV